MRPSTRMHSLAEQRIVGRDRLHRVDQLDAVVGALGQRHRFHQMFGPRVHARMHVVGHHFLADAPPGSAWRRRAFPRSRPSRSGVQIVAPSTISRPSEGMLVTLRMKAGEPLLRAEAELMRLLDAIVEIAARIGEADDVGAGDSAPEERRTEKSAVLSGWRTAPSTLPPAASTAAAQLAFEVLAERVVGGDEEPASCRPASVTAWPRPVPSS